MKWHNEKKSLSDAPAKVYTAVSHSSTNYSPKQTKLLKKNTSQKKHHKHNWCIHLNHWICNVCGRVYG